MTEHCRFHNCFHPEDIGCHAGEPDHKKCRHWQIGQLRNEVPGMLSALYRVQQSVHPESDDAASVAVSIWALEFLRDTEPQDVVGHG